MRLLATSVVDKYRKLDSWVASIPPEAGVASIVVWFASKLICSFGENYCDKPTE